MINDINQRKADHKLCPCENNQEKLLQYFSTMPVALLKKKKTHTWHLNSIFYRGCEGDSIISGYVHYKLGKGNMRGHKGIP